MMWVHMAGLMRDSVRPWGVSSSKSGEGSSVARAAFSHTTPQCGQHTNPQRKQQPARQQQSAVGAVCDMHKTTDRHNEKDTHDATNFLHAQDNRHAQSERHTQCNRQTEQASPRAASASMMRFTQSSCSTLRGICPVVTAATKATTSATRLMVSWNCRHEQCTTQWL